MSLSELSRLEVIEKIKAKRITQAKGASLLCISKRHIIRLCHRYERDGPQGLISQRRGQPSNERVKAHAIALIQAKFSDYGPTLAHESLTEDHGLKLSVETLRQLMIGAGIWRGKHRKRAEYHPMRQRRTCLGELVQIDGSHHDWFEGRGSKCCLLVFIDDATSRIQTMHFVPEETTQGYFTATRQYLLKYGRPQCFYSDKHSIFRVNIPDAVRGTGETQLSRALRELGIELICANSPQAKGRVERANGILRDRSVKALRQKNISDIESANAFVLEFLEDYNQRFARAPAEP